MCFSYCVFSFLFLFLRYVESQRTLTQIQDDKKARDRQLSDDRADQILRWKESELAMNEREAALRRLLNYNGEDSWTLWQMAMDTIVRHTAASAAYVANVSHPEDPEPALPEDGGEAAEGAPTEEADYAPFIEPAPVAEAPAEGEPAAEASEGASGGEGAAAPNAEAPEGGDAPLPSKVFDYSLKYLEFVVNNTGRDLPEASRVLRRPAPTPEGEEPPNPAPATPLLFSILDQNLKSLYFPDALLAPNFSFPGDFPRPGAFEAQAVMTHEKEIKAVLCADTLLPSGNGLALSQSDRDFITRVADALEANLTSAQERFAETQAANVAALKDRRRKLQAALEEALAPPAQAAEGDESGAAAAPAEEAAAPSAEGSAEAPAGAEEEVPPEVPLEEAPAEGEGAAAEGEDGEPAPPPARDPAKELERAAKRHDRAVQVLARAAWEARQAAKAASAAEAVSARQDKLLDVVRSFLAQVEGEAKEDFGGYTASPPLTFRALKAAVILVRPDVSAAASWTTVRALLVGGPMLREVRESAPGDFLKLSEQDRKRIRVLLRGLGAPESVAAMDKECPRSSYGFFLHRLFGQLRTAALALGAMQAAQEAKTKADQKAGDAARSIEELLAQIEALKAEVAAAEEAKAAASAQAEGAGEPAEVPVEGGEAAADAAAEGEDDEE